jgi:hypothetical protein
MVTRTRLGVTIQVHCLSCYIICSIEQSPCWEANSFSARQTGIRILWNPNVHYHVHKSPSPTPILSQINPVHTSHSICWRSILILFLPSIHRSSNIYLSFFLTAFPKKPVCSFTHPCHTLRPSFYSSVDHPHDILWPYPSGSCTLCTLLLPLLYALCSGLVLKSERP